MPSSYIKPEVVLAATHGLLEREIVLPQLVWRDPVSNFAGAKNETVSLRLPAYVKANKRALRSGSTRATTDRHQRIVDVRLDTDIYLDTPITDEELSLDIVSFGTDVLTPVVNAFGRALEDEVSDLILGADYDLTGEAFSDSTDKAIREWIISLAQQLNDANVPATERTLLVGTEIAASIQASDFFSTASAYSGAASMLSSATLSASLYGFRIVVSNQLPTDGAVAFHRTAFALSSFAPKVPDSVKWAARSAVAGIGLRHVKVTDQAEVADIFKTDAWVGSSTVYDYGELTEGIFEPSEDPDIENGTDKLFVRAVAVGLDDES